MIISIVSGTYNRLLYLQAMIHSARKSIGIGLKYEFVIVDGGSTDGTIEWCNRQQDIHLIEHGKLLGAVKAFNEGANNARGTYVILANDDIEFIDDSILCAIAFMQDNLDVGIGCFYQDRRGWSYHVEQMPAVNNGIQISAYYGQVCIVPKWLGDMVGWWGDYLYMYGGDNELSCNVLELGYKILPVPCACIHDSTPMDELRIINNNVERAPNGNHPDTQKWLDKWTKQHPKHRSKKLVGPNIVDKPVVDNPVSRVYRVLYAPIYEPGHAIQKTSKCGLRDALAHKFLVVECDYVNDGIEDVYNLASVFRPDMFLVQAHGAAEFNDTVIRELRSEYPDALFVNWNGDYHPEHLYDKNYMDMLKLFDLTGLVTTEVADAYDKAGIRWFYWQIGYEEAFAEPIKSTVRSNVVFMANGYSKARMDLVSKVRQYGINIDLYGSWPHQYKALGNTLYDFEAGCKIYRASKIALSDSQWPNATGFVSNRLFQAMAAGVLLMQQRFDGLELLGLQDGVHLVVWDDVDDLVTKIRYYLKHSSKRTRIARLGSDYVLEHHSFDKRVDELINKIGWRETCAT